MKTIYKLIIAILFVSTLAIGQIIPKKLLIYYSYPSSFNYPSNVYNLDNVANDLKQYDYVVLGENLELTSHQDHNNTVTILSKIAGSSTKVFGYIDLGVKTRNHSMSTIEQRVLAWKAMGVAGIFFDDFGYDFYVSRQRQNAAVSYVHAQNLKVIANGWNPDDVFGNFIDTNYNPTGVGTQLNTNDFYLSESYLIKVWEYEPNIIDWQNKADKLRGYQQNLGFKIMSVTTSDSTNRLTYDPARFFFAWHGAAIDSHEAIGWGEFKFSCCYDINALSPYRARPTTNIGTTFYGSLQRNGSEVYRYTNLGRIKLNTSTHTYGFDAYTTCTSVNSGNWHSASTWSCGRIPFDFDNVIISSGHKITLNQPAILTSCKSILIQKGAIFDCQTKFLARIPN